MAAIRFPNTVKHFRTIQPVVYILGLAGVALFIVLLIREGAEQVGLAIGRAGWGLLGLILYHQVQTLTDAAGWLVLIPKQNRVRLSSSFFLHWVAASINDLLPTVRVGKDIVLARVASMWGMPLRIATAAMFVDITIGVVTNVIFVVAACILLVAATGRTDLARPALVAVLTGTLAVMGFYAVQRMGIFRWSARLASRLAKAPDSDSLVKRAKPLIRRFGFFTPGYAEWRGVTFSGSCRESLLRAKFGLHFGLLGCGQALQQP